MAAGQTREMMKLIKRLRASSPDCDISQTRKGHWLVRRPGHQQVTLSHSPSDFHAIRNAKADLKRYLGIEL